GLPLGVLHQVVHLDEVDVRNAQPFERAVQALTRAGCGAVAGLRGQEEARAMLRHPRADAQLRVAVRRRGVDVIDAVLEQQLENLIGLLLAHGAERCCAEDHPCAAVAGSSEREGFHAPLLSQNARAGAWAGAGARVPETPARAPAPAREYPCSREPSCRPSHNGAAELWSAVACHRFGVGAAGV